MTFPKLKKTLVFILLFTGIYTFQFAQLSNKTTVLSDEYAPNLELKHLLFFSEVAYYYYYYRQIAEAPDFEKGFNAIRHDMKFTYPDEINISTKVTAWQEIIGGWLYQNLNLSVTPLNFYVYFIIAVHSLISVLLFTAVRALTASTWLGVVASGWYYSLSELANRLPFQPILRENLGLPPLLLALLLTLFYMRDKDNRLLIIIGIAVFFHGLFWQFSVITQTIKLFCLFGLWVFSGRNREQIRNLCIIDLAAYSLLVLIFWNNKFYAAPMYLGPLMTLMIMSLFPLKKRLIQIPLFLAGSGAAYFAVKTFIGTTASSHLVEFFLDRFFGIETFNSQLYRTVNAFSHLQGYHYAYLSKAMLLPFFAVALLITARLAYIKKFKDHELLLLLYALGFFSLSVLVFRFIIIALPLLLVYCLIMLSKYREDGCPEGFSGYKPFNKFMYNGCLFLLVAVFYFNLSHFTKIIPQSPNYLAQSAARFLTASSQPGDVIAADMVTSASLAHLIKNPLIIHPQYEYEENRRRVKEYNRAYGHTESAYMYNFFKSLDVDYVILTSGRCFYEAGESGINMREAIHFDFPKQTADTFCIRDFSKSPYFETVEQNGSYRILKVR